MDSIFWYDYETTGVDPARDRVIQFAGVRTSLDLERLEAPVERLCQLGDEVVPHAEALLVSGIRMAELMQSGIPEPGFAQEIHAQFSRPQTCVSGYNSLRFDDEFTRYLFYRNFYDPYAREWQSGNSRWDVIDLFRTAYALRPDGFNWPLTDNVPSFRLELLTSANHVNHGRAHDALSDVIATIDLSRLLKTAQPRLYDYYFSLRFKRNVLDQLYPLGKRAVVHVSGKYPASKGCCAIVLPLCVHPGNGNGIICYDLSQNPEPLLTLSAEEIARRTFTSSAALGDSELRIPLKVIHINRSPSVSPLATLDDSAAGRLGLDKSLCLEHMKRLQKTAGLVEKVQAAYSGQQFEERADPEWMLYQGGFFDDADRAVMNEVRVADRRGLKEGGFSFHDQRLDELLFRYRARHFRDDLSADEEARWRAFVLSRWSADRHPDEELANIQRLKSQLQQQIGTAGRAPSVEAQKMALLEELAAWLEGNRSHYLPAPTG